LFLGTNDDNVADMVAKGRQVTPRGEKCRFAKLTSGDVLEIRKMASQGITYRAIAKLFGAGESTISSLVTGATWGWITDGILPPKIKRVRAAA
jgi:hypothetical protein